MQLTNQLGLKLLVHFLLILLLKLFNLHFEKLLGRYIGDDDPIDQTTRTFSFSLIFSFRPSS